MKPSMKLEGDRKKRDGKKISYTSEPKYMIVRIENPLTPNKHVT